MDYEKEYKKLKADISNAYLYAQTDSTKAVLENILPELKESEDEKIRRCIGMCLTDADEQRFKDFNTNLRDCLNWLEKQGGEKPQRMISAEAKEALYVKPALSEFENALADICRGWIGEEPGWEQYIIDNADVLLRIAFKKFNSVQDTPFEQKPTAWSKEDEERLQSCLDVLQPVTPFGNTETKNTKWLKSLKDRVQPQTTWKPSDEQMKALDFVIDEYDGYPEFDSLVSLKNDLRKLKGEKLKEENKL